MERLLRYLLQRAGEASTWRGLVVLLTSAGVSVNPDQALAIGTTGVAIAGLIGVLFPDVRNGSGDDETSVG